MSVSGSGRSASVISTGSSGNPAASLAAVMGGGNRGAQMFAQSQQQAAAAPPTNSSSGSSSSAYVSRDRNASYVAAHHSSSGAPAAGFGNMTALVDASNDKSIGLSFDSLAKRNSFQPGASTGSPGSIASLPVSSSSDPWASSHSATDPFASLNAQPQRRHTVAVTTPASQPKQSIPFPAPLPSSSSSSKPASSSSSTAPAARKAAAVDTLFDFDPLSAQLPAAPANRATASTHDPWAGSHTGEDPFATKSNNQAANKKKPTPAKQESSDEQSSSEEESDDSSDDSSEDDKPAKHHHHHHHHHAKKQEQNTKHQSTSSNQPSQSSHSSSHTFDFNVSKDDDEDEIMSNAHNGVSFPKGTKMNYPPAVIQKWGTNPSENWAYSKTKTRSKLMMPKTCLYWRFVWAGERHEVELFHSHVSGKRTIRCDGAIVVSEKFFFDSGSRNDFQIGTAKHPCNVTVLIVASGGDFSYELFLNKLRFYQALQHWLIELTKNPSESKLPVEPLSPTAI